MATHTDEDLDQVLEIFAKLARELGTFEDPAYSQPGRRKNVFDFSLSYPNGSHPVREDAGDVAQVATGLRSAVSR
jgi:hypothetical protein